MSRLGRLYSSAIRNCPTNAWSPFDRLANRDDAVEFSSILWAVPCITAEICWTLDAISFVAVVSSSEATAI